MEKTLFLEAQVREHTGSKDAVRLRSIGKMPAVVYGHRQEPTAIVMDAHEFVEGVHHGHRLLDVKLGDKTEKMVIKELQYDFLGKDIIHVDLMRVNVDERVKVTVPLEFKGMANAKGTHEGGMIEEHADHIEVECTVIDLPEKIVVNVKEVGVGDSIHARDIELPAGTKLMSSDDMLIVTCHTVAAAKSVEGEMVEEEGPTAPEVITERKPVEEAQE